MPVQQISPQKNRDSWNEIFDMSQYTVMPDTGYTFRFVMDEDDLSDNTVEIAFMSYTSDSETGPWRELAGITYVGHDQSHLPSELQYKMPSVVINSKRVINKWVKVDCALNKRLRIGFEVEW